MPARLGRGAARPPRRTASEQGVPRAHRYTRQPRLWAAVQVDKGSVEDSRTHSEPYSRHTSAPRRVLYTSIAGLTATPSNSIITRKTAKRTARFEPSYTSVQRRSRSAPASSATSYERWRRAIGALWPRSTTASGISRATLNATDVRKHHETQHGYCRKTYQLRQWLWIKDE
ncbi:unnamed protein product [Parajaminaea phylloscopi]